MDGVIGRLTTGRKGGGSLSAGIAPSPSSSSPAAAATVVAEAAHTVAPLSPTPLTATAVEILLKSSNESPHERRMQFLTEDSASEVILLDR